MPWTKKKTYNLSNASKNCNQINIGTYTKKKKKQHLIVQIQD